MVNAHFHRAATIGISLLILVSLFRPAHAEDGLQPMQVLIRGANPFTDTWRRMEQRDARFRWEVAMGLRPPPPPVRIAPRMDLDPPRNGLENSGDILPFSPLPLVPRRRGDSGRIYPTPSNPQMSGTGFAGLTFTDSFFIPPDTMGAIGPNHFMEVINGAVAVFTRSGTRLSRVTLESFFTVVSGGTTYPRGIAFDPRVLYDRRSGRWFACTLEEGQNFTANHILLAVSRTSDATGTWDKYVIPIGIPSSGGTTYFSDYDTLGVDDNGVYFGITIFPSSGNPFVLLVATPKSPLITSTPSLGTVFTSSQLNDMYASPQPAHNHDAVGPTGRAWFFSSYSFGYSNVSYRYVTWSGGTPSFSSRGDVVTPNLQPVVHAPALGSAVPIDVSDHRLLMAVIRNNRLWTCRNVGLDSTGGSSGTIDRTGVEWMEFNVSTSTPSLVQSGRVFDSAASNPRFYYYPSIMVSGQGHVAMGFSGSKSTEFVGAYTCGRLATDPPGTMQAITLLKAGEASYQRLDDSGRNRWGDYSYTSLDPNDDMTMWTIQAYATSTANVWGTWITPLLAPAPTLNNPNGSGSAGQTGVVLNLTGTGFYDPGAGYANRLNVQLTGGTVNGISNYSITYNSPTSVTVTFDIAVDASPGPRNIVLTNPDGQSATVVDGFTVTSMATSLSVSDATGKIGETVALSATLTQMTDGTPISGKTIFFRVDGSSAGSATTDTSGVAALSYTIPEGSGPSMRTISANFAGDGAFEASSGSGTLTVWKGDSSLSLRPMTGTVGKVAQLIARLARQPDNANLVGRTIEFTLGGISIGSTMTNSRGIAILNFLVPDTIGSGEKSITASFAGDANYNSATLTRTAFYVYKADTALAFENASGTVGQMTRLRARLSRPWDGAAVAGRVVYFSVEGTTVGSAVTDSNGVATLPLIVPDTLGSGVKNVTATFVGDNAYNPSRLTAAVLTIFKTASNIRLMHVYGRVGQTVRLRARLWRAQDGANIVGRLVTFTVEGDPGSSVMGVTDANGIASARYTIPSYMSAGHKNVTAVFAGDSAYFASRYTSKALTISP